MMIVSNFVPTVTTWLTKNKIKRQMSVGPEATLSLLVGSSIAQQERLNDEDYHLDRLAWACMMTLLVGIFTFMLGIVRLGFLDSLMSRALLRGFISGVAVVVTLQQSIILLGLVGRSEEAGITEASSTIARIAFLWKNIHYSHVLSAAVSGGSVAFLLFMRIVKNKWLARYKWAALFPEVLVVVVVSTILTYRLRWDEQGLDILGQIESAGIPLPSIPSLPDSKHLKDLLVTSAMISVIGFVESVVIAKTYSSKHNYSVSANRELVALGVSNIVGGLFQGIPAFGSVRRKEKRKHCLIGSMLNGNTHRLHAARLMKGQVREHSSLVLSPVFLRCLPSSSYFLTSTIFLKQCFRPSFLLPSYRCSVSCPKTSILSLECMPGAT